MHKQWQLPTGGAGIQSLRLVDAPIPQPKQGEVVVQIKALSVNYRDKYVCEEPTSTSRENIIPLSDGAGVIHSVGENVTRVKVGDRVTVSMSTGIICGDQTEGFGLPPCLGAEIDGTAAQYARFNAEDCVLLPDYMSFEEAAVLPCAGVTAYKALNSGKQPLRPGSTVLVQGTGGVSVLAAQLAHAAGCRVIATSSSDEKFKPLVELGIVKPEDCINYRTNPHWGELARQRTTDGRGVDLVVDVAGPSSLNESLACVRRNGTIACVGVLTATFPPEGFNFFTVLMKQVHIQGLLVGPRTDFEQLMDLCAATQIHPLISPKRFRFEELKEALEELKTQKHLGKIVIEV